ncbi:PipA/GogA/GtgA family type III secretion system effector [Trinickia mobilis]|uniref:PipA/GogA/GtgA family type III secretion system effector n=1 Tax=Trinickia mobilis TaxID=2816356 RepID=UPI001A8BF539|nr:PipA/GogA/GtgA family type III secretion system effector [Trinickia mobilis]
MMISGHALLASLLFWQRSGDLPAARQAANEAAGTLHDAREPGAWSGVDARHHPDTPAETMPDIPALNPSFIAALNAGVPWEHLPGSHALAGRQSMSDVRSDTPQRNRRYIANVVHGQSAAARLSCTPAEREANMARGEGRRPEWTETETSLRSVESLLTRPFKAIVETNFYTQCGPIQPHIHDEIDRVTQTLDGLSGLLHPFRWTQIVGQISGRVADILENKPINGDEELNALLSFGLGRSELPKVQRSANGLIVDDVKYLDLSGERYAIRHEAPGWMQAYDPSRPAALGLWLSEQKNRSWRSVITSEYASKLTETPSDPNASGIRTLGDASFITYNNQYYPVQYDHAFHTWRIKPPAGSDHGYWIPVEYDGEAKVWSASLLVPASEAFEPFVSGKMAKVGALRHLEIEYFAVNREVTEQSMNEVVAVLSALHSNTAAGMFASAGKNLKLHVSAFNDLSNLQQNALRRFILSEPLFTGATPASKDIPLAPFPVRWEPKHTAITELKQYGDLLSALRRLPDGLMGGKPLIAVGESGLLGAFKPGDIVTNGELPLPSTANGKRVMHVLTEQIASGKRAKQDRQLVFVVHGRSARLVRDPETAGDHWIFLPNTRFRVESITWAKSRMSMQYEPRRWDGPAPWERVRVPADDSGVVLVRLRETLACDGPAPFIEAKNLRTGVTQRVLRPDFEEERLTAALAGANGMRESAPSKPAPGESAGEQVKTNADEPDQSVPPSQDRTGESPGTDMTDNTSASKATPGLLDGYQIHHHGLLDEASPQKMKHLLLGAEWYGGPNENAHGFIDNHAYSKEYLAAWRQFGTEGTRAVKRWRDADAATRRTVALARVGSGSPSDVAQARALVSALRMLPRQPTRLLHTVEIALDAKGRSIFETNIEAGDWVSHWPAFSPAAASLGNARLGGSTRMSPDAEFATVTFEIEGVSAKALPRDKEAMRPLEHQQSLSANWLTNAEWLFEPCTVFEVKGISSAEPKPGTAATKRIAVVLKEVPFVDGEPRQAKSLANGDDVEVPSPLDETATPEGGPQTKNNGFAHVDGVWQLVRYAKERARWELFDDQRPQEPGMPIVWDRSKSDDSRRSEWRSVVSSESAVALDAPLSKKTPDGTLMGKDGQRYIELYGRYYKVHDNGGIWRLNSRGQHDRSKDATPLDHPRGTPVRYDAREGRWDVRLAPQQPLRLRGGGGPEPEVMGNALAERLTVQATEPLLRQATDTKARPFLPLFERYFAVDVRGEGTGFGIREFFDEIYRNSPTFRRLFNQAVDVGMSTSGARNWVFVVGESQRAVTNFENGIINVPTDKVLLKERYLDAGCQVKYSQREQVYLHEMVHALTGEADPVSGSALRHRGPIVYLTDKILNEAGYDMPQQVVYKRPSLEAPPDLAQHEQPDYFWPEVANAMETENRYLDKVMSETAPVGPPAKVFGVDTANRFTLTELNAIHHKVRTEPRSFRESFDDRFTIRFDHVIDRGEEPFGHVLGPQPRLDLFFADIYSKSKLFRRLFDVRSEAYVASSESGARNWRFAFNDQLAGGNPSSAFTNGVDLASRTVWLSASPAFYLSNQGIVRLELPRELMEAMVQILIPRDRPVWEAVYRNRGAAGFLADSMLRDAGFTYPKRIAFATAAGSDSVAQARLASYETVARRAAEAEDRYFDQQYGNKGQKFMRK